MKLPAARHRWRLSPAEAIRLQSRMASEVVIEPLATLPRLVAGGDAAFSPDGNEIVAAWVVWDRRDDRIVETVFGRRPVTMPYIPGLLSFRETPCLLAAARRLRGEPELFMLDGQGVAHPRRFGLASHVGVLLGRPTIGCGKTRLCGTHDTPGWRAGSRKPLRDRGEEIGAALRTRDRAPLIYVSVGHRVDLPTAERCVVACCRASRIPEPTRLAHLAVTARKRELWAADGEAGS